MAHQRTVLRTLVFLCLIAIPLSGCSQAVDPQAETARLNAFVDEQYLALMKFWPEWLVYTGLDPLNSDWTDLSVEGDEKIRAVIELSLQTLRSEFDPQDLTPDGRTTFRMWELFSADQLNVIKWGRHTYLVKQISGAHTDPSFYLDDIAQVNSPETAEAYVARLEGTAAYLDQVTARIKDHEKNGVLPPKFVFPYVVDTSKNIISGRPFNADADQDSPLYAALKKKVGGFEGLDENSREDLITRGTLAFTDGIGPAYRRLIETLKAQEARATSDDGVWKLPDGEEFYQSQLTRFTTNSLDAESIHQIGLTEVARLKTEMEAIKKEVGFEGSLKEFSDFVRLDEQFYFSNDEEGRQAYLAKAAEKLEEMRQILPTLFGTIPSSKLEIRAVEKYLEQSSGSAFYNGPTADGARPGVYFVNLRDMADLNKTKIATVAFHEGLPGHHLQTALSVERANLPLFRRFEGYSSYSEGWAHYAETLGDEAGFYEGDPYSRYGYLNDQMFRAIRLVIDTGIHSQKWTRQEAIQYFLDNSAFSEGFVRKQVDRYIVWPGQATSYKIGQLKILELRERARTRLGEDFDIRAFHDQVLGNGAVPLDFLDELINGWIEKQAAANPT